MRAQSYGTQPLMRASKVRLYGTRPSLHDRAGTFASLIYCQVVNFQKLIKHKFLKFSCV